jgi:hypothetical protein
MYKVRTGSYAKGVACLRPNFQNGYISGFMIFLITLPLLPGYLLYCWMETHRLRNQIR